VSVSWLEIGRIVLSQDEVFDFLESDLGVDAEGIDLDTPLFSSQLVDSFALVTLMMFLERKAGIRIAPADVNLDNMDTIGRMLAYVARAEA
jgi:acyl carrier protein